MCYDVSFSTTIESIHDYFPGLVHDDQVRINFENAIHIQGHGHKEYPVIYQERSDGRLHLKLMEWGCIPFYIDDEEKYARQRIGMLNARSERILDDKSSYWFKVKERRCLVPVSGIYEHREIKGWKNKVPYLVRPKEQQVFFLPGLYSVARLPDKETGEVVNRYTYTLITREANSLMKQIHNGGPNAGRMPLFLPFETAQEWLFELTPERYKEILDFELPADQLEYWPVFTIRSTKPHPEDKQKNERYDWPGLPELELA